MVAMEGANSPALAQSQYVFVATLESVRIFAQLLRSIFFRDSSTWFLSSNGIKVTVEDAKCVQINAFIKSEIFQEFFVRPPEGDSEDQEDLSFSVNLNVVLECLNMFGGVGDSSGGCASPSLKICYAGYGHPLVLLLEDQGVVTDCQIKTKEAEECLDFNFTNSKILSKIIINSEHLKDVFSELDGSSEYIEFQIAPTSPNFRIKTRGPAGDCVVAVPSTSTMVELFKSESVSSARYRLAMLKHGIKPLGLSEKVSVRMDDREFLCLQYMVRTDDGPAFLEFYCAPEEESPDR